jgi:hypothetical protein
LLQAYHHKTLEHQNTLETPSKRRDLWQHGSQAHNARSPHAHPLPGFQNQGSISYAQSNPDFGSRLSRSENRQQQLRPSTQTRQNQKWMAKLNEQGSTTKPTTGGNNVTTSNHGVAKATPNLGIPESHSLHPKATHSKATPSSITGKPKATRARAICPRCQGTNTNKDGAPRGTQRHKCRDCKKRWFEANQHESPQHEPPQPSASRTVTGQPKVKVIEMENPKPTNRPRPARAELATTTTQQSAEATHHEAIKQHKREIQPQAIPTTELNSRITRQFELLAQARQFAVSLGEQPLHLFTQALEENIKPITAVVHNAVASALGYPTIPTVPPVPQIRDQPETPSPSVDQAALKKRLHALERANHDLRRESNSLNNQLIESTAIRQRTESQCRVLTEERNDLKILASELEQSRKSLKAELLEIRQKRELPAVEIRQEQTVDRKPPPALPEDVTLNREPTPRPAGGQSSSTRVAPPALTVAESQEIERMASALMATLVRFEDHKIRSADISSVTGIATGWKRTIEHLIGLGHIVHHNEFLCISYAEKVRRGLK